MCKYNPKYNMLHMATFKMSLCIHKIIQVSVCEVSLAGYSIPVCVKPNSLWSFKWVTMETRKKQVTIYCCKHCLLSKKYIIRVFCFLPLLNKLIQHGLWMDGVIDDMEQLTIYYCEQTPWCTHIIIWQVIQSPVTWVLALPLTFNSK